MHIGLRFTEKWMRRALWLVAFAFAAFLIGLGNQLVQNFFWFAPPPSAEELLDPAKAGPVRTAALQAEKTREEAGTTLEQVQHKHSVAQANTRSAQEAFDNWVATRQVTVRPEQDEQLIARNRALDKLMETERDALAAVEAQQQIVLDAKQAERRADAAFEALLEPARIAAHEAERRAEFTVFLYRLGLTLPLLALAGWLFKRKRNDTYWPFTWGFIIFALFGFFVELVPYLPSYGGYVRYGVGIVLTVVMGRYAIRWLHTWLARQKELESLSGQQRRITMRYDVAMRRLGKSACPSCERTVNFKDEHLVHCPHCGIGLFDDCTACRSRKNAFTRFCFSCGTPAMANAGLAD